MIEQAREFYLRATGNGQIDLLKFSHDPLRPLITTNLKEMRELASFIIESLDKLEANKK